MNSQTIKNKSDCFQNWNITMEKKGMVKINLFHENRQICTVLSLRSSVRLAVKQRARSKVISDMKHVIAR